jgi:hypothetical protein
VRRPGLTVVIALLGAVAAPCVEAQAHEVKAPSEAAYVTVRARIENPEALDTGMPALKRESAVVVCVGAPGGTTAEDRGCAAVWWDTRAGAGTTKVQTDRVLLDRAPLEGVSKSLSVVSLRVRKNELVQALAKAAAVAGKVPALQASAGAVSLRDVSTRLASLGEGRKKRTLTVARPEPTEMGATEVAFALDPKNRAVPRRLSAVPDCARSPKADGCDAPRVIVSLGFHDFLPDHSTWVDAIVESCALPKGETTVSLKKALDAAEGELSDPQLRAERRLLLRAEAVLAARAASLHARDPDRAAERLWAYFADERAGATTPLWDTHYRERAEGLERCIAELDLYAPVQGLSGVLAGDPQTQGDEDLETLAGLVAQMQSAEATFNDVFRDASFRLGQLEIRPMGALEHAMKNADEPAVTRFVESSPCRPCRLVGKHWLDGREKDRAAHHDGEVRVTLLETDRALEDMQNALSARQTQLAQACRAYDAGHTGRLLADVKDAKDGVAALIGRATFDDAARRDLASLRTNLLELLPQVISTRARPVESACGKRAASGS